MRVDQRAGKIALSFDSWNLRFTRRTCSKCWFHVREPPSEGPLAIHSHLHPRLD